MTTRRESLATPAGTPMMPLAGLVAGPAVAAEGRRLVKAHRDTYRAWERASDAACAAGLPWDDVQALEDRSDDACGAALEAEMVPVAATLARRTGRPVQVTASRTEQVRGDALRCREVLGRSAVVHDEQVEIARV